MIRFPYNYYFFSFDLLDASDSFFSFCHKKKKHNISARSWSREQKKSQENYRMINWDVQDQPIENGRKGRGVFEK